MPAAANQRFQPSRPPRFFWQGMLILLPLAVLATAGVWSLTGQRAAVEQKARQEAEKIAKFSAPGVEAIIRSKLLGAHRPVPLVPGDGEQFPFLYPLNPEPPEDPEPDQQFQKSLGNPSELAGVLRDHPGARSAAGIPLKPLILYQQFLTAPEAERGKLASELSEALIHSHPSVLSEPLLLQLGDPRSLELWQKQEAARKVLRRHTDPIRRTPKSGWTTAEDGAIWRVEVLADPESGEDIVQAMPLASLPDFPAKSGHDPPVSFEYFSEVVYYDGLQVGPSNMRPQQLHGRKTRPSAEPFANHSHGFASVYIFLTDPQKLYAQHDLQVRWFIGVIAASALTALFGLWVTRRAFLKQQAVNQMKSNFVSSVSHELRAPIASIRLMAERLRAGKVGEEHKRSEYFGFIEQESRRLATLVENVLDFSRIEDGRKAYHFKETEIEQLAADTVQLMRPHAAEHKLELSTDFHPLADDPCVDALEVQQALINLIDNAIKYSPEGTTITVGLESGSPGTFSLWVQDQGQGIPREEQQKIFERFYRVGSELERETQGVGIGLAIVRHTVEAHGGTVRVTSRPGEGSRFTIELPIMQS